MSIEVDTKAHKGDVSPSEGINNNVFNEASEIPHVHKEFKQGDQHAGVEMIKPSAGLGHRTDCEVDQLEQGREQGNVAKNMTSFESKADKEEASRTPI